MGFLKKLFGNVEKANKGEIPVEEIVPPFTIDLAEVLETDGTKSLDQCCEGCWRS